MGKPSFPRLLRKKGTYHKLPEDLSSFWERGATVRLTDFDRKTLVKGERHSSLVKKEDISQGVKDVRQQCQVTSYLFFALEKVVKALVGAELLEF